MATLVGTLLTVPSYGWGSERLEYGVGHGKKVNPSVLGLTVWGDPTQFGARKAGVDGILAVAQMATVRPLPSLSLRINFT